MWGVDCKKERNGDTGFINCCQIWKLLRRCQQKNGCPEKTNGIN